MSHKQNPTHIMEPNPNMTKQELLQYIERQELHIISSISTEVQTFCNYNTIPHTSIKGIIACLLAQNPTSPRIDKLAGLADELTDFTTKFNQYKQELDKPLSSSDERCQLALRAADIYIELMDAKKRCKQICSEALEQ